MTDSPLGTSKYTNGILHPQKLEMFFYILLPTHSYYKLTDCA